MSPLAYGHDLADNIVNAQLVESADCWPGFYRLHDSFYRVFYRLGPVEDGG